jgi:hypothetical protein
MALVSSNRSTSCRLLLLLRSCRLRLRIVSWDSKGMLINEGEEEEEAVVASAMGPCRWSTMLKVQEPTIRAATMDSKKWESLVAHFG